jgi:protein SCO1
MWEHDNLSAAFSRLGHNSSEEAIAAFIDAVRVYPAGAHLLVPLLEEQHGIYRGKGSNQVHRIKGYLLAAFANTGLPAPALPFVVEILQNSRTPYLVAGAAKALRTPQGLSVPVAPFLLAAIRNIRFVDDAFSFAAYGPYQPQGTYTSALQEILITLQWLGSSAADILGDLEELTHDNTAHFSSAQKRELLQTIRHIKQDTRVVTRSGCCFSPAGTFTNPPKDLLKDLKAVQLHDQEGRQLEWAQFFRGVPAVVAFFYTRCDNPLKCSLTVTRMGELQKKMQQYGLASSVKIGLITYDPVHDTPAILKAYCVNRGIALDSRNRVFRVPEPQMESLRQYFQLGVNYSGTAVNQHKIELYLLDHQGQLRHSFTRLQWQEPEVLNAVRQLVARRKDKLQQFREVGRHLWTLVLAVVIAFFPKCPLCWAAYASFIGLSGLQALPYRPWLLPLFFLLMGINLWALARAARRRNRYVPFCLSLTGALILLLVQWQVFKPAALDLGLAAILSGSLLHNLPMRFSLKRSAVDGVHQNKQ